MMKRASVVAVAMLFAASGHAFAGQKESPTKKLPLAGETLIVDGSEAFLIMPEPTTVGRPTAWVWYAPTLPGLPADAERWMFERFLTAGIAICRH